MFINLARRTLYRYHAVKNMQELNNIIKSIKTPYVLDFTASWCGPCKMLWPVIEKRQKESNGKWAIIKVDVDIQDLSQIVSQHQIVGVPTLAFYKQGKKLKQQSGYLDDKAFKKLQDTYLV